MAKRNEAARFSPEMDPTEYGLQFADELGVTPEPYREMGGLHATNPWFKVLPAKFQAPKPEELSRLEEERDRLREELNRVTAAAHGALRENDTETALQLRDRERELPRVLSDVGLHILRLQADWARASADLVAPHHDRLSAVLEHHRHRVREERVALNQASQALNHLYVARSTALARAEEHEREIRRQLAPEPPTMREVIEASIQRRGAGRTTPPPRTVQVGAVRRPLEAPAPKPQTVPAPPPPYEYGLRPGS